MGMKRYYLIIPCIIVLVSQTHAQRNSEPPKTMQPCLALLRLPDDADTLYILKYCKENDVRFLYGAQGSSLAYGSSNKDSEVINNALYNNVNDLVGFGLTYKFIDFDLSFSLPKVRILEEDRQNLSQFRLVYSMTGRKFAVRAFFMESKGVIVADQEEDFKSNPDVHVVRVGAQLTYYFNFNKYSFRAANFQNELQRKSAGSFLVRLEPFYRTIGMKSALVPTALDVPATYGKQVGLEYVKSPGVLIMPGYGFNFAAYNGKFFVSPIVFFGTGFAVNVYRTENEKYTFLNAEWAGSVALNVGYNGRKTYVTLRGTYEAGYFKLDPSYFTTSDLKVSFTVGLRFGHLEKFIPLSLF